MLKVTLPFPNMNALELEGDPQACADFVWAFRQKLNIPKTLEKATDSNSSPAPSNPAPQPKDGNNTRPDKPSRSPEQPRLLSKTPRTQSPKQAAASGSSKRDMILRAMSQLAQDGLLQVSLSQIQDMATKLYPEGDFTHFDQAVRDLANKTDLLTKPQRGIYALSQD